MQCINCSLKLTKQPRVLMKRVNTTIRTVLNNWISPHKVQDSDKLCEPCYHVLQNQVSSGNHKAPRAFGHTSVCHSCGVTFQNRKSYAVRPNSPELEVFKSWIPAHQIPHVSRTCVPCWKRARRVLERRESLDAARQKPVGSKPEQEFDMVTVMETITCVNCGGVCDESDVCLVMHLGQELLRCLALMKAPLEISSEEYVCGQCIAFIQKNLDSDMFKIKCEPNDTDSSNIDIKSESINSSGVTKILADEENFKQEQQISCIQRPEGKKEVINVREESVTDEDDSKYEEIDTLKLESTEIDIMPEFNESTVDDQLYVENDSKDKKSEPDLPNRCIRCNKSTLRRRHRKIAKDNPISKIIEEMISPRELPQAYRICNACWMAGQRRKKQTLKLARVEPECQEDNSLDTADYPSYTNIKIDAKMNTTQKETQNIIEIPNYKRVSATGRYCLLKGCKGSERKRIPSYIRMRLLTDYNVYVPDKGRICQQHLNKFDWEEIRNNKFLTKFTNEYVADMMSLLSKSAKNNRGLNFEDEEAMSSSLVKFLIGISHEQFKQILLSCPSFSTLKHSKTALGAYLLKLKTGESNTRIATLSMKRRTLERFLKIDRNILLEEFVPLHLGFDHISGENVVQRQLLHPEGLFGNLDSLTVVGQKYVYMLRKSAADVINSDKATKPFLLSTSDGYILDVLGPLDTKMSDSDFNKMLFDDGGLLANVFVDDDIFVLDKQSKEIFGNIMVYNYGLHTVNPLKAHIDETSSTTEDKRPKCLLRCLALSKQFALCFKREFKMISMPLSTPKGHTYAFEDMRIAAAMTNAFYPTYKLNSSQNDTVNPYL